ncbi:The BTB (BR-C, ttk and bab)/POZ (Pox virus and Zinc finger) domain [Rhizoctonia solani]|uniref:The BTB (BR-C, ttk and bab)/POZ (Pox virus and Zinc finger) domain n=1 Tax=Rhizoctonia solani TaxID=456999 RepID=A0A8H8SVK4_9AGAM|nr:The BTB (BR-C, ttk and bab)/POZ (Pox virus and Zinc finger) domain [Rhizoctonia solani]QRW18537.1 The BTB (BR-C, ttk and bab)/POZ (Pox virus and Zinc finger) domain [Rhizoctonia solani]
MSLAEIWYVSIVRWYMRIEFTDWQLVTWLLLLSTCESLSHTLELPLKSPRMVDAATIPNTLPPPNEGFTHGGDLVLRSTDNVDFSVHALFLSVASPVFSDLLKSGSREEVVLFSERAELLALMLKFIYPRPTPNITSLDLLDDAYA